MAEMEKDIQRLNTENIDFRRRLEVLESNDRRHDEEIRALFVSSESIKTLLTQLQNSQITMQQQMQDRYDKTEAKILEFVSKNQKETLAYATTLLKEHFKDNKDSRNKGYNFWQAAITTIVGAIAGILGSYFVK